MVPLPYIVYDAIAFPLKLLVAKVSVATLKAVGVIVWREGNIIMFPNVTLEVADACSGLRSLMSLLAIGVSYAFIFHNSRPQRILLILMAVPIAMISNMFRVIATGFLAQYYGAAAAEGFFHEFAGLAVFALAMGLLLLTGMILRRIGR
jgi:exosortase